MNEENMRNQSNVIYGAPCKVMAASEDRNLVQFANDEPNKVKRHPNPEELDRLERILSFGAGPNWKERMQKDKKSTNDNKQITQAAMPDLSKKISVLERLLRFGSNSK